MRPIDADRLLSEEMKGKYYHLNNGDIAIPIIDIEHAPTIQPKTAKWIKLTGMAPPEYHGHKICSVCESFAPYNPLHPGREMLSPYCPGCGAKMEVKWDDR